MNGEEQSDTLFVAQDQSQKRLDQFLATQFSTSSRSYFQFLIKEGLVLVNGIQQKKRYLVQTGDEIEVEFALTAELSLEPEEIALDILYEDKELIAINKPPGLVVHPAPGHPKGTFVNALLFHCRSLPHADTLRPGIVHRLDKETSGVLLAAKTALAHERLVTAFAMRSVKKTYLAICIGNPGTRHIDAPIARHRIRRKEMAIAPKMGREALTDVETLGTHGMLSALRLYPKTGRTHQLRVHLKSVGAPILGDETYGNKAINAKLKVNRQLLHAYEIELPHPLTQHTLKITAPLPTDIEKYLNRIVK